MVENGGEITAPISISLEFQMRSDSSLLPFYSYADYCKIENIQFLNALAFQSRAYFSILGSPVRKKGKIYILPFSGKIVGGEKSAKK